jgi:hypothetical protein
MACMDTRRRPVVLTAIAVVTALLVTGCTSSHGDTDAGTTPPGATVDAHELDASVTQNRFAEGTRDLLAGVTNDTGRELRISSATIRWPGLDFPTVAIADPVIPAGQTAAFTIEYGAAHCDVAEPGPPSLVAVVDGTTMTLPVRVEDPGLLRRLRDKACARVALDAVASVTLRLAPRTTVAGGTEVLPGRVLVRRRADATGTVTVDDLGGSVLFAVVARDGRRALPARLRAHQTELSVPVLIESAGRCDAHSRSQSSQTFLFSVYAHRDTAATQRVIQVPSAGQQQRLLAMLDRVCG